MEGVFGEGARERGAEGYGGARQISQVTIAAVGVGMLYFSSFLPFFDRTCSAYLVKEVMSVARPDRSALTGTIYSFCFECTFDRLSDPSSRVAISYVKFAHKFFCFRC